MYNVDSMNMRNEKGYAQALCNRFTNVIDLENVVAECDSPVELLLAVNRLSHCKPAQIYTDNERLTQLIFADATTDYLEIYKIPDKKPAALSKITDSDLIMELISRGYSISNK